MEEHYLEMAYARVSTKDQNLERQEASISEAVPDLKARYFFKDKFTGKDFKNRPAYNEMKDKIVELKELQPNIKIRVTFHELDRMGRNFEEFQSDWYWFTSQGVHLRFLDVPESISQQTGVMGQLVYMIIIMYKAAVAEQELNDKKKRCKEGIERAHAAGVKFGRKAVVVDEKAFKSVADKAVSHTISHTDAMKILNMKPYLYWKHIKLWYPNYQGKHKGIEKK